MSFLHAYASYPRFIIPSFHLSSSTDTITPIPPSTPSSHIPPSIPPQLPPPTSALPSLPFIPSYAQPTASSIIKSHNYKPHHNGMTMSTMSTSSSSNSTVQPQYSYTQQPQAGPSTYSRNQQSVPSVPSSDGASVDSQDRRSQMEAWRTWSQNMTIDRSRATTRGEASERRSSQPTAAAAVQQQQQTATTTTAAPQPVQKKRPTDPYYGHERTAVMSSRFIISLFNCPNVPPVQSVEQGAPTPSLGHFIAYALHRTRLPHFVTLVALLLLRRLKLRFPAARGSSGHRLFISAFMIASKVVCDDTYSNQSWCVVGQKMFSLKEVNQMEREMCGYLEWNLNATAAEVDEFELMLVREHGALPGGRPIAPLKKSAVASSSAAASSGVSSQHSPMDTSSPSTSVSVSAAATPSPLQAVAPRPVMPLPKNANGIPSASSSRRGSQQRLTIPLDSNSHFGVPPHAHERPASAVAISTTSSSSQQRSMDVLPPATCPIGGVGGSSSHGMFRAPEFDTPSPAMLRSQAQVQQQQQGSSTSNVGFGGSSTMTGTTTTTTMMTPVSGYDLDGYRSSAASSATSLVSDSKWSRSQSSIASQHLNVASNHLSPYPGLVPSAMSSLQSSPESAACQTPSPAITLGSGGVTGGIMPSHVCKGDIATVVPVPW